MKKIVSTHKLTGSGKVFVVNLKALFRAVIGNDTRGDVTTSMLDVLRVQLERPGYTGIANVPRGTSGDYRYALDSANKVMTITLTNLPAGTNILTISAQTGTNEVSVRQMVLIVKDNATGTDASETVNFDGQDILTLDADISTLTQRVGTLEVGFTDLRDRVEVLEDSAYYKAHVYGVLVSEGISAPVVTRIGDLSLHRSLPVQSKMKGGLLTDEGDFTPFTSENDWTADTKPRDGSEGQVMVLLPEHWRKVEIGDGYYKWLISDVEIEGFDHIGEMYVSAYKAALDRTNDKLCSIVNADPQFRGGNNEASWDETYRSLLGTNATSKTEAQFRTAAHNRGAGWEQFNYYLRDTIIMLYVIEYANRNSQAAYDSTLDENGCHRGGLGPGVTNMPNWSTYNSYNPFIPCGASDSLGNRSGVITHNVLASDGTTVYYAAPVNRYRGIEMPFGHTYDFCDGVVIEAGATIENGGTGLHKVFRAEDPANWGDTDVNDETKYTHVANQVRSDGYIKTIDPASMTPTAVGGSASTYYPDYNYQNVPSSGVALRACLVGDLANSGVDAGLFFLYSYYSLSVSNSGLGSRLGYLG